MKDRFEEAYYVPREIKSVSISENDDVQNLPNAYTPHMVWQMGSEEIVAC